MSMEVSSSYKDYKNDYLERLQEGKDETKEARKEHSAGNKSDGIPVPKDEYNSSEQFGSRPSGLYRMGQDVNGRPRVLYDDPKKAGGADKNGRPKVGADSPDRKTGGRRPIGRL